MTSSRRITLNTLATYVRSIFSAGLALFSSRWVLSALGQTDFGLFALVGSLIAFVSILNGIVGGSAGRFFAFAIGKGDAAEVNQWFNTAFAIHAVLPVALIVIGWPLGEICIRQLLNIPAERTVACVWVWRLSLIAAFVAMFSVPYVSMFTAKQRIAETALWGVLQVICAFVLALNLSRVTTDRLVFYATGMVVITIGVSLGQIARAIYIFPECRLVRREWLDSRRIRQITSFAVWSTFGGLGSILRNQGTAILLNLFHGPKVNAAYGIANQVSSQTGTFTQAMMGAMSPEITAMAGRNDRRRLLDLALRASKFGTLLALFFSIPLLIEMDFVLHFWLKSPPPHAITFCQILIVSFLLDKITMGHLMAVNATGRIAAYQATVGGVLLLTLPLGYCLLKVLVVPAAAMFAILITSAGCSIARLFWGQRLLSLHPRSWLSSVLGRCLLVGMSSTFFTVIPSLLFPASLLRLGLSTVIGIVANLGFGWFFGLTPDERNFVTHSWRATIAKFCQARATVIMRLTR